MTGACSSGWLAQENEDDDGGTAAVFNCAMGSSRGDAAAFNARPASSESDVVAVAGAAVLAGVLALSRKRAQSRVDCRHGLLIGTEDGSAASPRQFEILQGPLYKRHETRCGAVSSSEFGVC